MIVYVESNFVLELALLQEESAACEEILQLAQAGVISLTIPAFSLGEPYETLVRRHRDRRSLADALSKEMNQLRRSIPYEATVRNAASLPDLLVASGKQETDRLNAVLSRLVRTATILPTDHDVMEMALASQQPLDLAPQDSIVYASVRKNVIIKKTKQCFINKNVKDFLIPQIEDEFDAFDCKLLGKFTVGLDYIKGTLGRSGN